MEDNFLVQISKTTNPGEIDYIVARASNGFVVVDHKDFELILRYATFRMDYLRNEKDRYTSYR